MSDEQEYRSLRDAFGQFATGITIVTALGKQRQPIGLTANSFASVSLEPALVSWCVDKSSTRFEEFVSAQDYSISVLSETQTELSNLFAQRSWDDTVFADVGWNADERGIPQLDGVSARFHCRQTAKVEAGDHIILIGEVTQFEDQPQPPLVFFQGDYRALK